ncbi:hypothetical protein [Rehaibacterium terrae]|jgi:hypothetical protein|uniref:Uncharacterized protein n=1 Tax=Rehaibacterium terrae TaxID=1341696 RepID=A0A7W7Y0K2_9GAMM|nr:hypothetical protein [Rehaibacterium terrae]MBB5015879.1 hypothetical protein [Rehaibacterium terrae]
MAADARKTLWIDLSRGYQLRCDGPALRVQAESGQSSWVPWHRLALLILEGRGEIGTDVLIMAARHGVRLRVMSAGQSVCDLEPAEPIVDPLDAQWDELLENPDWRRSWAAFRLRQTLWAVARAVGRPIRLDLALFLRQPGALAARIGLSPAAACDALRHLTASFKLDARCLLLDAGWSVARLRRPRPGPDLSGYLRRQFAYEALGLWRSTGIPDVPSRWHARHRERFLARGRSSIDGALRWLADITCLR